MMTICQMISCVKAIITALSNFGQLILWIGLGRPDPVLSCRVGSTAMSTLHRLRFGDGEGIHPRLGFGRRKMLYSLLAKVQKNMLYRDIQILSGVGSRCDMPC